MPDKSSFQNRVYLAMLKVGAVFGVAAVLGALSGSWFVTGLLYVLAWIVIIRFIKPNS